MNSLPTGLALTIVLAGALAGWLTGRVEMAGASPYDYYVYVHPGGTTSGSYDDLNCGYHATCSGSPNEGTGLDWANSHGENVYYRGYSSNSAGYSWSGTGWITEQISGNCYSTFVSQYKRSGAHNSTVAYIHTGTNYEDTGFTIAGGYYPTWTSTIVGQTLNEPSECNTTGAHLHQATLNGGNHWKNTYYPEMSSCSTSCGSKNVMSNYQLGYYWSE